MPPIPSIYINLEDDIKKIIERIQREKAGTLVLVFPKRCFLFHDSINLKLLKKQTDILEKKVFILTMDERGQEFATQAGFELKFMPTISGGSKFSDIKPAAQMKPVPAAVQKKIIQKPETSLERPKVTVVKKPATQLSVKKIAIPDKPHRVRLPQPEPVGIGRQQPAAVSKVTVSDTAYATESVLEEYGNGQAKHHTTRSRILTTSFVVVSLLVLLILFFAVLPKATVIVYPRTDAITRDWTILLSANVQQPDAGTMVLPATTENQALSGQDSFEAQGKKQVGNKAEGAVVIYNFTRLPLNLKASTTVLTLGTQNYYLEQDAVNIKPTTYTDAATKQVDANSLSAPVAVIAADGGDDYNAPANTRLEITNKVFGSKPQLLYAEISQPITNGTSRYLSVVTQQDLDSAEAALASATVAQFMHTLDTQDLVLPPGSYTAQVTKFMSDQPVNSEAPTFTGSIQMQLSGLAYSRKNLQDLITQRINPTLPTGETLQFKVSDISNANVQSLDTNKQTASLAVHFQGQAAANVNLDGINQFLVGKTRTQAGNYLLANPNIQKVDITLSPTWQKNFPFFKREINIITAQPAV